MFLRIVTGDSPDHFAEHIFSLRDAFFMNAFQFYRSQNFTIKFFADPSFAKLSVDLFSLIVKLYFSCTYSYFCQIYVIYLFIYLYVYLFIYKG